jgi:hypothetical protein
MDGDQPLVLACNVTTTMTSGWDGTSTAKYFVCKPVLNSDGTSFDWTVIAGGTNGIILGVVDSFGSFVPRAGNPHGVAQIGGSLNVQDYDSVIDPMTENIVAVNIYTVTIAALKAKTAGGNLVVTATPVNPAYLPQSPDPDIPAAAFRIHGSGLITLTDQVSGDTSLFAEFNGAIEDPTTHTPTRYTNGTVVKFTATLSQQTYAVVGKNALGLVPLPDGAGGHSLAIPCQGDIMHYGTTNGMNSSLYRIDNIFAPDMNAVPALIGDWSAALTPGGTRDFKSVTFSEDGLFGFVLCVTYNSGGMACWKLYQTTAANILRAFNMPISTAIDKNLLVFLDGEDGVAGSDWEVLYENATPAKYGRLWFVRGTTIQVSQGNLYSTKRLFSPTEVYGSAGGGYINSADLIREMIFQFEKGHSINTNLIKNRTATKLVRAAAAKAAAAPEEEEK